MFIATVHFADRYGDAHGELADRSVISGPALASISQEAQASAMSTSEIPLSDLILSALQQSPFLAHRKLRFEAEQGRVVLRGVVNSYYQKQMAQEALRGVEGIDQIENQLEVCWV